MEIEIIATIHQDSNLDKEFSQVIYKPYPTIWVICTI
jgi:hypothetical protein